MADFTCLKKGIRAGIAGSDFAAKFHDDTLQRVYSIRVDIAGAYSPNPARLSDFKKARVLKVFANLEDLTENSDIVHVRTPITHESLVVAALERNKHVIVDKPSTCYFGDGSSQFNGESIFIGDRPRERHGKYRQTAGYQSKSSVPLLDKMP